MHLWGYCLNTNFRIIMELCNDVSLLGWKLLKTANKLLGHGDKTNGSIIKMNNYRIPTILKFVI